MTVEYLFDVRLSLVSSALTKSTSGGLPRTISRCVRLVLSKYAKHYVDSIGTLLLRLAPSLGEIDFRRRWLVDPIRRSEPQSHVALSIGWMQGWAGQFPYSEIGQGMSTH